eukprot:gene19625-22318_t
MAVSIALEDLPVLVTTNPILHNSVEVGNYGTTAADVIVPGAQPHVQNPLPHVPLRVGWDSGLIPYNWNPINRTDLPVAPVIPANATVTNRHTLLDVLKKIFIPPSHSRRDYNFLVSREGDTIHLLDRLIPQPGQRPRDQEGGYGIPFENLIATEAVPNSTVDKYFVFQSYSLWNVTQLVVRCELDCVYVDQANNNQRVLTEIKSRRGDPNGNNHAFFFRSTWYQMLFGCAQRLVVGFENHNEPLNNVHSDAIFNNISSLTFDEVRQRAQLTQNDRNALVGLASLIEWIRNHIADGEAKAFTFRAPFTLTLSPPL